jgi:hypothetical protein
MRPEERLLLLFVFLPPTRERLPLCDFEPISAQHRHLVGRRRFQALDNDGVWVEEVRLEGSYPDTTGLFILRDDRQPGCRFAWRLGELWDWRTFQDAGADPDDHAGWIELELDEDVEAVNYGIPIRCLEDVLTFMGKTEVSLNEAVRRAPFPVLVPTRLPATSEPQVLYEERRRFRPYATLDLVYRFGDGLLVSCQTEGQQEDLQDLAWERVDRAVGERRSCSERSMPLNPRSRSGTSWIRFGPWAERPRGSTSTCRPTFSAAMIYSTQ